MPQRACVQGDCGAGASAREVADRRGEQSRDGPSPEPSLPLRRLTGTHRPTRNLSPQLSVPSPSLVTSPAGGLSWHPHLPGLPTPALYHSLSP